MTGAAAPAPPARDHQNSGRWRDLALRTASASVLGPAAIACLWIGGVAWIILVAAATLGLAWEWTRMLRLPLPVAATIPLGVTVIVALLLRGAPSSVLASALFGVVLVHFLAFRRLAPAISPGKTWSGAAGGLLAAGLAGYAIAAVIAPPTNLHAFALASSLGLISQLGDLAESALKRHAGVKDSGRLIPGHGGVFDRLDGLLATATAMGLVAAATGNGVVLWR